MREQARADKLSIRTGLSDQDRSIAWAVMVDWKPSDEAAASARHLRTAEEARSVASRFGHTVVIFAVKDQTAAGGCINDGCVARLYLDWSAPDQDGFMEGEALDENCRTSDP